MRPQRAFFEMSDNYMLLNMNFKAIKMFKMLSKQMEPGLGLEKSLAGPSKIVSRSTGKR